MDKMMTLCPFTPEQDTNRAHKSIASGNCKVDTLAAIEEVQKLKQDPYKKTYGSFKALLEDMDSE